MTISATSLSRLPLGCLGVPRLVGSSPPARPAISMAKASECPVPNACTTPPDSRLSAMATTASSLALFGPARRSRRRVTSSRYNLVKSGIIGSFSGDVCGAAPGKVRQRGTAHRPAPGRDRRGRGRQISGGPVEIGLRDQQVEEVDDDELAVPG